MRSFKNVDECLLPDKLSDLIEVALKDLSKVEKNPRYVVDMGVWHDDMMEGVCHVCLAGAVLAGTCKLPHDQVWYPAVINFGSTTSKLIALDFARRGNLDAALRRMGPPPKREDIWFVQRKRWITKQYHIDPVMWREQMEQMVRELRERGL